MKLHWLTEMTPQSLLDYLLMHSEKYHRNFNISSALDKLLGQLGIYATWLSSIAYLQKQLRIFIFFTPSFFFFCNYTFSYCLKPSEMCSHIYSLPLSAFLKYQTSGFYYTPRKLCLWWGILFSRCPSVRAYVRNVLFS